MAGRLAFFKDKASLFAPLASLPAGVTRYLCPFPRGRAECSDFPLRNWVRGNGIRKVRNVWGQTSPRTGPKFSGGLTSYIPDHIFLFPLTQFRSGCFVWLSYFDNISNKAKIKLLLFFLNDF